MHTGPFADNTRTARVLAGGGLLVGAAGIGLQAYAGLAARWPVPPGAVLLLVAAAVVALSRSRVLAVAIGVIGLGIAILRLGAFPAALLGREGLLAGCGQWLLLLGIVAILVAGTVALRAQRLARLSAEPGHSELGADTKHRSAHLLQVAVLLVLAPICAEYLAAYDRSTGYFVALLSGLLIFVPLYGAPALLIREIARRANLGWRGIIPLATAFGLLQAGVVDQSLFSEDYRGIESWADTLRSTYIEPLGIGLHNVVNFIGGHVIYSFCAPVAIAEAIRPQSAREPWLGRVGLAITFVLYVLASLLILVDHLEHETSHASAMQVAVSLVIVTLLIGAAFWLGRQPQPVVLSRTPTVGQTFAMSLVLIVAYSFAPEDWSGALLALSSLSVATVLLWRASRTSAWSLAHTVVIATTALLTRGGLAFLYFPLIGEVSAIRKYGHNLVLLAIVSALCYVAWRASRHSRGEHTLMR